MKARWWVIGLLIALAVALLSPLASASPDGLERVAEDHGFLEKAKEAPYALIADYLFPWVGNEAVATILAGIVGTLAVFSVVLALTALLHRLFRASQG